MAKRRNKEKALAALIEQIKSSDPEVRTSAWQGASRVGAAAVGSLAQVMQAQDIEVARAAKRAMWKIVHDAGRPGGRTRQLETELAALLGSRTPVSVRREVLWMLSEIGGKKAIEPMAELLGHQDLREDARMALERIPLRQAVVALKDAFEKAPEDFKPNLAQSLRKRGAKVKGYPCRKLVPVKQTAVKPLDK